jgi:hypothetical protein
MSPNEFEIAKICEIIDEKRFIIETEESSKTIFLTGIDPNYSDFNKENSEQFTQSLCPINSIVCIEYDQKKTINDDEEIYAYIWYRVGDIWISHNLALINNGFAKVDGTYFVGNVKDQYFLIVEQIQKYSPRDVKKIKNEALKMKTDYTTEDYLSLKEMTAEDIATPHRDYEVISIRTYAPEVQKKIHLLNTQKY